MPELLDRSWGPPSDGTKRAQILLNLERLFA